jgi:hypothetical protein
MFRTHSTIPDTHSPPGDDLIPNPKKTITHSIVINASAEAIWPWLVQLGAGRAGWYSFDRVDNGGKPSAVKIIPELQHLEVGDIMPAIPGSKDAFIVEEIQIGRTMVLVVPMMTALEEPDPQRRMKNPLRVSWALILEPINAESTRLISRGRISENWLTFSDTGNKNRVFIERVYKLLGKMPWSLMLPIAETGHYFMESRMLRGIKKRTEQQNVTFGS